MDFYFLPPRIFRGLGRVELSDVYEIRLRKNFPVILNGLRGKSYLGECGQTLLRDKAIICREEDINFVVETVTERSLYAFNEEIKQGFLTAKNGVRIGLCGECVFENESVVTIKNFSSLNIRIPREIPDCADFIYKSIFSNGIHNTLIIAPPSKGKTTVLKDLIRKLDARCDVSVLVMDERGEFAAVSGENVDKTVYSDKLFAFTYGLRSMSPDVVVTDELCCERDFSCAKAAADSGVKIIASIHGESIKDVLKKSFFAKGVFERYVVIKGRDATLDKDLIYDEEFNLICD